jgi:uncharacterized membrane protein
VIVGIVVDPTTEGSDFSADTALGVTVADTALNVV